MSLQTTSAADRLEIDRKVRKSFSGIENSVSIRFWQVGPREIFRVAYETVSHGGDPGPNRVSHSLVSRRKSLAELKKNYRSAGELRVTHAA